MKSYRLYDIVWDCSGDLDMPDEWVDPDLPSDLIIEVDDEFDPADDGADWLSDEYGYFVEGFSFEEVRE